MRFPKAMLAALTLTLAAGSIAVAQPGDKMVTAELFASLPQSVGNITFTPDNRGLVFTARDAGREEAWSTNRPWCARFRRDGSLPLVSMSEA